MNSFRSLNVTSPTKLKSFFLYKQTLCYSLKVNKVRQQTDETDETGFKGEHDMPDEA